MEPTKYIKDTMKNTFFHPTSSFYPPTRFCQPSLRPSCFSLCCSTTEDNILGIIIARILKRSVSYYFVFHSKKSSFQKYWVNSISSEMGYHPWLWFATETVETASFQNLAGARIRRLVAGLHKSQNYTNTSRLHEYTNNNPANTLVTTTLMQKLQP